jgi:hypothetical protein
LQKFSLAVRIVPVMIEFDDGERLVDRGQHGFGVVAFSETAKHA